MNTDHDIKSTSPPPPKKLKVNEEDKGGKSKVSTKGEKAKKEPSKSKNKMKKSPSPETDTVCEVCQRSFVFEVFEVHVEQEHLLECPMKVTCELRFVHLFEAHKI